MDLTRALERSQARAARRAATGMIAGIDSPLGGAGALRGAGRQTAPRPAPCVGVSRLGRMVAPAALAEFVGLMLHQLRQLGDVGRRCASPRREE
jgi:hypothetical protein